jgi:hypothetical protein
VENQFYFTDPLSRHARPSRSRGPLLNVVGAAVLMAITLSDGSHPISTFHRPEQRTRLPPRLVGMARRTIPVALLAVLALTACSSATAHHSAAHPSVTPAAPAAAQLTPDALVGLWKVTAAAGEPSGSVLRVASSADVFGVILFRSCGELSGGWAASTGGSFIAMTDMWSNDCSTPSGKDPTPAWLSRARGYRIHHEERDLLAADGTVLAKLLPGGTPHVSADILPALRAAPTLGSAAVRQLREVPKSLPAGATAATQTTIAGRWVASAQPHAPSSNVPSLTFSADGNWSLQDGCYRTGGRFTVGQGGRLLTIAGVSAAVGCAGMSHLSGVASAKRAAVDGNRLVLYADDGRVVARLTR